jgi:hypothetical protein
MHAALLSYEERMHALLLSSQVEEEKRRAHTELHDRRRTGERARELGGGRKEATRVLLLTTHLHI